MARKQDWSPRAPGAPPRFKLFEDMARDLVGDGKTPDLFFVSAGGNIVTITLDFGAAYEHWKSISKPIRFETMLEDRLMGAIAIVEEDEDHPGRLVRRDDSTYFIKMYGERVGYQPEE